MGTKLPQHSVLETVSLSLNEEAVPVVPERSVVSSQGQQFVYVVGAENKVSRQAVEVGRRRDGLVEVKSGLTTDNRVVTEGVIRVRPGLTVRVQGEEAPAQGGRPPFGGGPARSGGESSPAAR